MPELQWNGKFDEHLSQQNTICLACKLHKESKRNTKTNTKRNHINLALAMARALQFALVVNNDEQDQKIVNHHSQFVVYSMISPQ